MKTYQKFKNERKIWEMRGEIDMETGHISKNV